MRIIRRYSNRKLYDTAESRYATMAQLSEIIRGGEEVQVVNHVTGGDITTVVLLQALYDQEKRGPVLSASGLTKLIRNPAAL